MSEQTQALLNRRAALLGPNVSTFYDEPVHLVRGEGVHVWDADGRRYLDCYNNVPHVGHCNQKVVEAICRQASTLNTHTRYLHETILDYLERLTSTFEEGLDTAILTCTGSEANDIALRMARAVTGRTGIIATDHTYHGNTMAVSQLSKTNPPPDGPWPNVAFVPAPDSYRPLGGRGGAPHAEAFANAVDEAAAELERAGHGLSAIILCPYFANEGFPSLETGWLRPTLDVVRKRGGLFIADEVQPGFGRTSTHMWGHQRAGVTPDIVTLGKPHGQWPSGRRCRHAHRNHGGVPQKLSVFQHLWRQPGILRRCTCDTGSARRRKAAGQRRPGRRLCARSVGTAGGKTRVHRRRTGFRSVLRRGDDPRPRQPRTRHGLHQTCRQRNASTRRADQLPGDPLQHPEDPPADAVLPRECGHTCWTCSTQCCRIPSCAPDGRSRHASPASLGLFGGNRRTRRSTRKQGVSRR